MNPEEKASFWIKEEAKRLGFLFCGISKAEFLENEAPLLEKWLNQHYQGEMAYMANHFDKRLDPRKLVEGAETVISLAYNYFPSETQRDPLAPKISRYAYGEDYHSVMKDKIYFLLEFIQEKFGDIHGRVFVDSAPVMERTWAEKSGLGWIGKNTLLIHKKSGSYFFLGEIICDLKIKSDQATSYHCGTCTRCMDACPTQAITQAHVLDAQKCISYHTIELKSSIPEEFQNQMENWAFGCDICQEVCPWNRFSLPHNEPKFQAPEEFLNMDAKAWEEITEEVFNRLFQSSPLKRTGYTKIKQTLKYLKG